jgi:two-component system OmpR family sensor kinase
MKNQTRDRPVRHALRPGALKTALARASLRVRVMASAAVLVAVTSLLMGLLGTVLLLGYLFGRVDAQLRKFSAFISKAASRPPGRTEAGRLAVAINAILGRIEAAYRAREDGETRAHDSDDRMRRFVADASHELRTPLTSVRGLADFYFQQGEAAPRAEVTRMMAGIQQEAARMGRLVEDLLLLAHFDVDRALDLQPVDLSSAAVQAAGAARARQPERPLTVAAAEPVIVSADAGRIRQVIDNLLGNALQHTSPGTPVTVTVAATTGQGQLSVADSGPGLSADQAIRVFDRFYRTDRARSRASGGAGLGLSIAAALVAAHGGTITVDTRPGRGATFTIRLPLADRAAPQPSAIPQPSAAP